MGANKSFRLRCHPGATCQPIHRGAAFNSISLRLSKHLNQASAFIKAAALFAAALANSIAITPSAV